MKCHVCGSQMRPMVTDFPFKINEKSIVIIKDLPVWQCDNCVEYLLEDLVMRRVEDILKTVNTSVELEIIRYAA